jgi:hypothetical protein
MKTKLAVPNNTASALATSALAVPEAAFLFEPVEDAYGHRLALVFGNEAVNGVCPFHQHQCYHCDIGAGEGAQFDFVTNQERLKFFQHHYQADLAKVNHLLIYNSGSTLNQREMSKDTLSHILNYAASLPSCTVISLDSREMFITPKTLTPLLSQVREDQHLRIILGLESQSDQVRIGHLNKRMSKQAIAQVFACVGQYGGKIGLDINIIFQPPTLCGEEAIREARLTAEYALTLATKYDVAVDFNFHPYYPSLMSLQKFPDHPRAILEDGVTAIRQIKQQITASNQPAKLFIGWQDEGHDQEAESRQVELGKYQAQFHQFNQTQLLEAIAPTFASSNR